MGPMYKSFFCPSSEKERLNFPYERFSDVAVFDYCLDHPILNGWLKYFDLIWLDLIRFNHNPSSIKIKNAHFHMGLVIESFFFSTSEKQRWLLPIVNISDVWVFVKWLDFLHLIWISIFQVYLIRLYCIIWAKNASLTC